MILSIKMLTLPHFPTVATDEGFYRNDYPDEDEDEDESEPGEYLTLYPILGRHSRAYMGRLY